MKKSLEQNPKLLRHDPNLLTTRPPHEPKNYQINKLVDMLPRLYPQLHLLDNYFIKAPKLTWYFEIKWNALFRN